MTVERYPLARCGRHEDLWYRILSGGVSDRYLTHCTEVLSGSSRTDILVSMTRSSKPPISSSKISKAAGRVRLAKPRSGFWVLQDAKARFSELVRKVRSEGPQHVTVHGRDEVVVVAAEEFRRLQGRPTGQALIAAMQASPYREIDLEPTRAAMPVRDVSL